MYKHRKLIHFRLMKAKLSILGRKPEKPAKTDLSANDIFGYFMKTHEGLVEAKPGQR